MKLQLHAEDLTLSILSIFNERCPGDPEPEPFEAMAFVRTLAINVQGWQTSRVQGHKGSRVVMVLPEDEISVGRLQMARLKTSISRPRLLGSKSYRCR